MQKIIIGIIALLLVGGIAFAVMQNNTRTSNNQMTIEEAVPTNGEAAPTEVVPSGGLMMQQEDSKTVAVTVLGGNYAFSEKEIRVKQGDTVRVTFTNSGGMHDFVIDDFDARTKVLNEGQSETIEFVANEKGTYEYYCSVGNHRQMGMKGNLIVE